MMLTCKAEDVVRSYHLKAIQTLQDMRTEMLSPLWDELSTEQQSDVASNIARLYGTDQYTSEEICSLIDGERLLVSLSSRRNGTKYQK